MSDQFKRRKPRGVIVWDFDGVLFETGRHRLDAQEALRRIGIPAQAVLRVLPPIGKSGHFSIAKLVGGLRAQKIFISEKRIRKIFHDQLLNGRYYSSAVDMMLHRLKKGGFLQFILSSGMSSFQYKKMFVGCNASFRGHFSKLMVTTKPKYVTLLKVRKKYPYPPMLFIDDTKSNLELARLYVPEIITIYYSNVRQKSIKQLERTIVRHATK